MKNNLSFLLILNCGIFLFGCEKDPQILQPDPTPQIEDFTSKYIKNVLVEDFTGTWCGYCPRVSASIDDILKSTDKVAAVAIHDDSDMGFSFVTNMMSAFNITGYPTGLIDRSYIWPYPESMAGLSTAFLAKAPLGIKISSSIVNNQASIAVAVEFAVDIPFKTSISVYLLEDSIIANQRNYYNDGRGDPIVGFVHNHVLRKAGTNVFGNEIPGEQTKKDQVVNFTYAMSLSGYQPNNCHIVAFVTRYLGSELQNVQYAKLGETKDFQIITK